LAFGDRDFPGKGGGIIWHLAIWPRSVQQGLAHLFLIVKDMASNAHDRPTYLYKLKSARNMDSVLQAEKFRYNQPLVSSLTEIYVPDGMFHYTNIVFCKMIKLINANSGLDEIFRVGSVEFDYNGKTACNVYCVAKKV
jgi:hypothetical protein